MVLRNVNIIGQAGLSHIHTRAEKIVSVFPEENKIPVNEEIIDCGGAIVFPGLINSHDHLEFNLFSQLGNRIYKNYTEWGDDIHKNNKEEISKVLEIPLSLRIQWGLYKNLLNGVTTVVNHGEKLKIENDLITVFQNCYSLHSPAFEKNWKWKLNLAVRKKIPFVMHLGEGTDEHASKEIDTVIRWNYFKRNIIAVHGVTMNINQARHFKALVWCPASNIYLLGQTARVEKLGSATQILFGTDSTLTATWNAWEQIRLAKKQNKLSDEELFLALTAKAAAIWGLNTGELAGGKYADIVVAKRKEGQGWNNFFSNDPEDILLVFHKGVPKLVDERFYHQFKPGSPGQDTFRHVQVKGNGKYLWGDLPALANEIKKFYPGVLFPVNY